jgi:hypothetical protein
VSQCNWYRQARGYDPATDRDFIGYHCQSSPPNPERDGIISREYAQEYFAEILDSLPFSLKDEAGRLGLLDTPENQYDDNYESWAEKTESFFSNNGVRWIFVSDNKALASFGNFCFYVSMGANDFLWSIEDVNVNDYASAYIYMITGPTAARPKLFPIPEDRDDPELDKEADTMYWGKRLSRT